MQGGTLQFGIDSDSANPWAPYRTSCAGSCFIILGSISDSLFAVDPHGAPVPLLLKGVDHNADYTQWTFHVRDGIKFQDGTPLDGDAVKFNIDSCLDSPLTASAYSAIDNVTASGQDVTITTKGGPWVALPTYFAYGQCGYMMSKQWLSSLSDIPQRNPKAPRVRRHAGGDAGQRRPGQAGRPRCVQVRVVHAGQRQLVQGRDATRTTGVARTASPVRSCRTSTRSRRWSTSTPTAATTRCAPATSTR